jgi:hypothetical protein
MAILLVQGFVAIGVHGLAVVCNISHMQQGGSVMRVSRQGCI